MNYIIITENEIQLHLKKYFHRLNFGEIIELQKTLDRALLDLSKLQKGGWKDGNKND